MGAEQPKQSKPTLEDTLIEMKMAAAKMAREAAKSMKESETAMKNAKIALKKQNEEEAKLYLQSAAEKRNESMSIKRMSLKMQFLSGKMRNMENSAQIMNSFQSMGRLINNNAGNVNFEQMSSNMQNFERTMDELLINTKMIEEMMGQNGPVADTQADDMLQVLKGQLALEENNQINEAALIHQREIEYANNLKKL